MDDVRAVMDAAGSEQAALLGSLRGRCHERSLRRDAIPSVHGLSSWTARLPARCGLPTTRGHPPKISGSGSSTSGRARGGRPSTSGRPWNGSPRALALKTGPHSGVMIRQSASPGAAVSPLADEHADRRATCAPGRSGADTRGESDRRRRRCGVALPGRAHPRFATSRAPRFGPCRVRGRLQAVHGGDRAVPGSSLGVTRDRRCRTRSRACNRALHGHRRLDREGCDARRRWLARARAGAPRPRPTPARSLSRLGDRHRWRRLLRDVRRAGACDPLRLRHHARVYASSGSRFAQAFTRASANASTRRSAGSR